MAGGVLKSNALIRSIKRRAFIPEDQQTFDPADFLEMATEEVNISLMDQIIETRGDFLVYYIDVPLVQGKNNYPVPSRATGNKLRDVSVINTYNNNVVVQELAQISLEELSDYQANYNWGPSFCFYMLNNEVMFPATNITPGYALRMWFYMRPNALVVDSRGATVVSTNDTVEIDNLNPQSEAITNIAVGGIVTSQGHGLTTGQIAVISGSDSTPTIDGNRVVTYIDEDTFSVDVAVTVAGTVGTWNLGLPVTVVTFDALPPHFTITDLYDSVQAKSPNKIIHYDMPINNISSTMKQMSFPAGLFSPLNKGDYVTIAEETVVPNMPTEYHPIIAQRVACACLEAMGDKQNLEQANAKLAKMEMHVLRMVDNRVEGAPKKLKNRHGTLRQTGWNWISGSGSFRSK